MTSAGSNDHAPVAPLKLADAADRIRATVRAVEGDELLPLRHALDRVLARDVIARVAVPAHDNAAMDGYAVDSTAVRAGSVARVVGVARAGHPYTGRVERGACVRILTGAVMPPDCDAVAPQEATTRAGDDVTLHAAVGRGQHRRLAGEDFAAGAVALASGRRLTPADLGIAASVGEVNLSVHRRPRIAVFSSGSELRDVGDPLPAGAIRDANRYALTGMLQRLGADVVDLGIVGDDPDALQATLKNALVADVRADAIITSGGVSAGDADHTRAALQSAGHVEFWTLAIKPGRPMAFGTIRSGDDVIPFFGLPGNPVAVMVVFYALVRNAIVALTGATPTHPLTIAAIADEAIAKSSGRSEFVRGVLSRHGDRWHVTSTGSQGSGILRSMHQANCLIVLDHDQGPVAIGGEVTTWPFDALI